MADRARDRPFDSRAGARAISRLERGILALSSPSSMGKPRGKKAWRAIDASAAEDALAGAAAAVKSGAHVAALPDAELFVLDTAPQAGA